MTLANSTQNKRPLTYISLFSGAGVGCFGFKQEGFSCIATVEILEKRLKFQRYNNKCAYDSGYISGDLRDENIKQKILKEVDLWKQAHKTKDIDVLIATPPCQGMSIANHKKKDEKGRNSLIVESIKLVKDVNPKFFIFENVKTLLTTTCTDLDGKDKKIKEAIEVNLAGHYHICYQVLNFKDYGSPSSRTRTLVVGTRKDLREITPYDIFPNLQKEKNLRETIGNLPSLHRMGEIDPADIYHHFRSYSIEMLDWIKDLKEGQSAFDNKDHARIPHKKVNGVIVYNKNKNGDKYQRCYWNKPGPCIHTRNDILASQNTVHPSDNRVFSVRELMKMMSIPGSFCWSDIIENKLNALTPNEKKKFLAKEEMNIRHSIGESVPTVIFRQIASKIRTIMDEKLLNDVEVGKIVNKNGLVNPAKLKDFLSSNIHKLNYPILSKIAELSNSQRLNNSAYYTRQDICYSIIKDLPEPKDLKVLRILEPSIGVGNFLPLLIEKYKNVPEVIIDVVDIDKNSIDILKVLMRAIKIPKNFKVNFIVDDFLLHDFTNRYDLLVGNPPYKKLTNNEEMLRLYKKEIYNDDTNNIFSFFIEKSLRLADTVSLIVPKSLINAPEFNKTRELLSNYRFQKIIDYGEEGFKGVKIETISFIINTQRKSRISDNLVEIESYISKSIFIKRQDYIFPKDYPYWIIYRDEFFDKISKKLKFDVFKAYRDRQITKKVTRKSGKIRVLKSRNIGVNRIVNINGYDCFIDEIGFLGVSKYLNKADAVLVPNLTYYPRACFLPRNAIVDGSVAILTPKNGSRAVTEKDLEYYATKEFEKFYAIARNYGTRSLNIDNNSVFFFGIIMDR